VTRRPFTTVFVIFLILSTSSSTAWAYYNPKLGRFMQRDPVGPVNAAQITPLVNRGAAFVPQYGSPTARAEYHDGLNLYQYAKSCPTRFTDPGGLMSTLDTNIAVGWGALFGVGLGAGLRQLGLAISIRILQAYVVASVIAAQVMQDPATVAAAWQEFELRFRDIVNQFSSNTSSSGGGTAPPGGGGNQWQNFNDREFRRYLETLQSMGARSQGQVIKSIEDTRAIYQEALRRGWEPVRGIEATHWYARHIHLRSPGGNTVHFPVPDGFTLPQ